MPGLLHQKDDNLYSSLFPQLQAAEVQAHI